MPALAVTLIRFLVVAIIQTGAYVVASNALERLADYLRDVLTKNSDLSKEDIDTTLRDEIIDAVTLIGVTVFSLKTKIPLRLAEKLGLTSNITKKLATSQTKAKVTNALTKAGLLGGSTTQLALKALLLSFAGSLPWLPSLVQQFGDQATFNPKNANNYYETFFGVRPFKEPGTLDSPGPFGATAFNDYAYALETQGITGINDPYKYQTVQYSRAALADLIFAVYGDYLAQGQRLTESKIVPLLPQYYIIRNQPTPRLQNKTGVTSTPQVAPPKTVFVGTVSQGRLAAATDFEPRQDDLITDINELDEVLRDNLSLFLQSALGRFVYETKVVSSVTTRDGFTQRGQTQQVVSGYNKDGTPKYKTVTNRFAVADVYFITDRGTRTKAGRITLGPTDAVRFHPSSSELNDLDLSIRDSGYTKTLSDVTTVQESKATTILSKPEPQPLAVQTFDKISSDALARLFREGALNANPPPDQLYADTGKRIYVVPNLASVDAGIFESVEEYLKAHEAGKHYNVIRERLKERYGIDFDKLPTRNIADLQQTAILAGYDTQEVYNPGTGNVKLPIFNATSIPELIALLGGSDPSQAIGIGPACQAANLSAFFAARGEKLPSVEVRSILYEQFDLGARSYYVGSGTQNVKLLAKLKQQAGCPIDLAP